MIIRHGAGFPKKNVVEIQQKVEKFAKTLNRTGKATLCHEDLQVSFRKQQPQNIVTVLSIKVYLYRTRPRLCGVREGMV